MDGDGLRLRRLFIELLLLEGISGAFRMVERHFSPRGWGDDRLETDIVRKLRSERHLETLQQFSARVAVDNIQAWAKPQEHQMPRKSPAH